MNPGPRIEPRHDDDTWLDALAGRPAGEIDRVTALEARLLREQLLRTAERTAPSMPPTVSEANDFAQRLQRERAAGGAVAGCEGCAARGARWKAWLAGHWLPLSGALASLALMATVVSTLLPQRGGPPLLRAGEASAVKVLADEQPQRKRDELARRLKALGGDVQRYERLGRFGIDARFTLPLGPSTTHSLRALGLEADGDGVVRVEFEARAR